MFHRFFPMKLSQKAGLLVKNSQNSLNLARNHEKVQKEAIFEG
jgi:hypothetical protein